MTQDELREVLAEHRAALKEDVWEVSDVNVSDHKVLAVSRDRNLFRLTLNDKQSLTATIDNPILHTFFPFLPAPRVPGGSQGVGTLSLKGLA